MSTKNNSPDVSREFPHPVTGRNFAPVGREVLNDQEARKTAHPAHPMVQIEHGVHPYNYRSSHGRNFSFKGKGPM